MTDATDLYHALRALAGRLPPKPAALSGVTVATDAVIEDVWRGHRIIAMWRWSRRRPGGWRVAYEVHLGDSFLDGENARTLARSAVP